MSDRRLQAEIAELLETARPELTAELEARAVAAVEAAQVRPVRPRRRWIAVAVGAAVALVGLGFVPFPAGGAKGALDRAMAAFEGTSGLYLRYHDLYHGPIQHRVFQVWEAPGGLSREEHWDDGKLGGVSVTGPDYSINYTARDRTAWVYDLPPAGAAEQAYGAHYVASSLSRVTDRIRERSGEEVKEWRERRLWGGERDMVEITWQAGGRVRWEMEAATGRLVSWKGWAPKDSEWKLTTYTEEVEWDVEIPSDTWTFDIPKGTTVSEWLWWKERATHVLATGKTQDWQVTLHALDVSARGDVYVTLSLDRLTPAAGQWRGMDIQGYDDQGVIYHPESRQHGGGGRVGYRVLVAQRDQSAARSVPARAITLTLHLRSSASPEEQILTFPVLPLPPPQAKEDLFAPDIVQY